MNQGSACTRDSHQDAAVSQTEVMHKMVHCCLSGIMPSKSIVVDMRLCLSDMTTCMAAWWHAFTTII